MNEFQYLALVLDLGKSKSVPFGRQEQRSFGPFTYKETTESVIEEKEIPRDQSESAHHF
jgi:hypothetical protein